MIMTICGRCEHEWPTDEGIEVCARCGTDGNFEPHAIRDDDEDNESPFDTHEEARGEV